MLEHPEDPRHSISTAISVTVLDVERLPRVFTVQAENVYREGVTIAIYGGEKIRRLVLALLWEKQSVALDIVLPLTGERIKAIGQPRCYYLASDEASRRYLRAGIFLEHMSDEDRAKWTRFVEDEARMAGKEAQHCEPRPCGLFI